MRRASVSSLKFGDRIKLYPNPLTNEWKDSQTFVVIAVDDGSAFATTVGFDGDRVVTLRLRDEVDDSYHRKTEPYWRNVNVLEAHDEDDVKPSMHAGLPELGDQVEIQYPGATAWRGIVTALIYMDDRENRCWRVDVLCLTRGHIDHVYKGEYRVDIECVTII